MPIITDSGTECRCSFAAIDASGGTNVIILQLHMLVPELHLFQFFCQESILFVSVYLRYLQFLVGYINIIYAVFLSLRLCYVWLAYMIIFNYSYY
jgi:hypothetical protein